VEAKGISFAVLIPIGLPDVTVDPSQIERVLANLVVNAIRYTKQGEIRIGAETRGNYIAVSVLIQAQEFHKSICRTSSTSSFKCREPRRAVPV
jgi:K+-sensing histidine kinase KdpD